jgi:capsid protein
MADNTEMATIYSNEWAEAYEQKQSWLRGMVQTKGDVSGDTFKFILEGDADEAVSRGANNNIPYADDNQSSTDCSLAEYHHLARKNNFNIYSSSVDQRLSMQRRGVISTNKKTDSILLTQLDTTSFDTNSGSAAAASLALLSEAVAILDANFVPRDGERYGLLTPMAWQQMMKVNQFSSGDWVSDMPFMKHTEWRQWNSVKWSVHPGLSGVGTSTAKCFAWHKWAVGHALNKGNMTTKIGQNEEHDYSWARTSSYQGGKLLRAAGVVRIKHNDTASLS